MPLLQKILKNGSEVSMIFSYKNFENMVIHCLEPDETRICISKKLVGLLLDTFWSNRKSLALQKPDTNDALVKALMNADPATWKKMRALPDF